MTAVGRRAVVVGLAGAAGVQLLELPAAAATYTRLGIIHASMQYSDTTAEHAHDAATVFGYARRTRHQLVAGTEGGHANSLWWQLPAAAAHHGYQLLHHPAGEWLAVDRRFGVFGRRGHVSVPGSPGRGIAWARIAPHDPRLGLVVLGTSHWRNDDPAAAAALAYGVGRWARRHGRGRRLVFYTADTNTDDRRADVFHGAPLETCWDDVRRHPGTRFPGGPTIDVIARLTWDQRTTCVSARRLADEQLPLSSDHCLIAATYQVRHLATSG